MTNAKHARKDLVTLFLSDKETALRYGVSRQTIWDWLRKDKFPAPVKLNGATRWKLAALEQWEADQEVSA